uniref:Uncharacterized protein n=1 Tax=Anguilla anguilla TaxID=7936 RepID=A0A0E9RDP7_ANGAN
MYQRSLTQWAHSVCNPDSTDGHSENPLSLGLLVWSSCQHV